MIYKDNTYNFFEKYLLKYQDDNNLLSKYIIVDDDDSNMFFKLKNKKNFSTENKEELLGYQNAIYFYESIGLLRWNNNIGSYVIDPTKLAIKCLEFRNYEETIEKVKVPVKS